MDLDWYLIFGLVILIILCFRNGSLLIFFPKSHFQKMLKFYIWKAMFMLSTTKNKIILNSIIFELLKLKHPPNRSSTRPLIWLFIKSIPTQVCNHASIDIVELHKETPTKTDKQNERLCWQQKQYHILYSYTTWNKKLLWSFLHFIFILYHFNSFMTEVPIM